MAVAGGVVTAGVVVTPCVPAPVDGVLAVVVTPCVTPPVLFVVPVGCVPACCFGLLVFGIFVVPALTPFVAWAGVVAVVFGVAEVLCCCAVVTLWSARFGAVVWCLAAVSLAMICNAWTMKLCQMIAG